ncbi:hypothetical protein FS837_012941 [Tulasnella sp. UAMH 9824]|nr:hypothetical protein FS837_012941 [Tulasnella sp. UAMH 9824]
MFSDWLAQRQLTLDVPRIYGKEVEPHKLSLIVGALGGCRAVVEKNLWPVVGAKIGFPYFNGPAPYSKAGVADRLSKLYQDILADFEVHWHNSLRSQDLTSISPLRPELHSEVRKVAITQFPLQQQQPQRPHQLGGNASESPPSQIDQQTPQIGQTRAATQQQEAIMRNKPGVAIPPQPGLSSQGGPIANAVRPIGNPTLGSLRTLIEKRGPPLVDCADNTHTWGTEIRGVGEQELPLKAESSSGLTIKARL